MPLVDLALSEDDRYESMMPPGVIGSSGPQYPSGLRICLCEQELEKLKLDSNCDIGDVIDLRAFAVVTSINKSEGPDGPCCRIELQIQKMSVVNEMTEEE